MKGLNMLRYSWQSLVHGGCCKINTFRVSCNVQAASASLIPHSQSSLSHLTA